jgi:radical SAM protein with 4Fe4S-binding SPASM domain
MMRPKKETAGRRIQAKELRCQKRQPLQDVLPLPAPFVIYIDPTNKCNFRCMFCPTGDKELLRKVGRSECRMSLQLFKKIVDDLKAFPCKLKLANVYKDGEPLLNPHFPEMIRYLKDANVVDKIWTKTNGALLKPDLNRKLVAAGLDLVCISVEAVDAAGYLEIANAHIDYEKFRENVKDLYDHRGACEIYIKIADSNLSAAAKEKFFGDFQDRATHIGIEKLMGWSFSSAKDFTLGTHPDTYDGLPFVDKDVCAYPFYVFAVNSDGSVSLCGNDWSQSTAVGNVTTQSLKEIWDGDALFEFRRMLLEGRRRENRACGDCFYLRIVPDNIDAYRSEILAKLKNARRRGSQH